ncbi:MAG: hypothetical protein QOJ92_1030 [Frankiales bacterium]|nr:hypothetical protein [Frankiales bacterium]
MTRLDRRLCAVLVSALLMLVGLAPASAAHAAGKLAAGSPAALSPRTAPAKPHSKPARGAKVFKTLRGTYQRLTTDVANDPTTVSAYFPPDISSTHDELRDVLVVGDKWIDIKFPPGKRAQPGQQIELSGYGDDTTLDASIMRSINGSAAIDTTAVTKTLVILAYWGGSHDSVTRAKAADVIFTQGNAWWKEVSYGLTSVSGTVVDWVSIAGPDNGNCYGNGEQIMTQARTKAAARIGSLSGFERTILYFPYCAGASGAAGWAYAPGTHVWLNGYMDKRVSIHEQGHNYGLLHAHSVTCSSGALTGSCSSDEYGDDYDAMGGSGAVGHFNVIEKAKLAWVSGKVYTYTGSSTYTIAPIETTGGVKGAKATGPVRTYWIEYRTKVGQDNDFSAGGLGLLIHTTGTPGIGDGGSNLLDLQKGGVDSWDGAAVSLTKGSSWTSPDSVRITFVSSNSAGAQVNVTYGAPPPKVPGVPGAPTGKAGDTTALVSWGVPSSNGGDSLIGYRVYYQKPGAAAQFVNVLSGGGLVHATNLTGLTNEVDYSVWVVAQNGVGFSPATAKVVVRPKLLVPTAAVTAPASGFDVRADSFVLTANAIKNPTSGFAIAYVDFYLDGQFYSEDSTAPYSVDWDSSEATDGGHTVQAWAVDTNNRVGRSAIVSFTLHKPVPTVTIKTPVVAGSDPNILDVHLSATSGSPQTTVQYVILNYDGEQFVGSIDSPANLSDFVIPWDTRWVTGGTHVLRATVYNSLYRQASSAAVTVEVSHPTPTVAITSPLNNTTQFGNFDVTASVTKASGESDIQYVEVIADNTTNLGADWDGTDGWTVQVQAQLLAEGPHVITARAVDADGFAGTSSAISVTYQRPAPSISITSPSAGATVRGDTLHPTFDVATVALPSTDAPQPISRVEILLDGTYIGDAYQDFAVPDHQPSDPWTAQISWTSLAAGVHTLTARATDQASYAATSAPVSVTVQVPSPVVNLIAPADGSTKTASFTLSATAEPNADTGTAINSVVFIVDGQPLIYGDNGGSGTTYTGSLDPNSYDSGIHHFAVQATDVAGYGRTSPAVAVTFDTPGPTAAITSPAASTTLILDVNPVTVTANVLAPDGSSLTTIGLQVDGSTLISAPDSVVGGVASFSVPPDYLTSGAHVLAVEVSDDLNRTRHSLPVAITALRKPQAPYAYVSPGDGKVTVQWYVSDNGGAPVQNYTIKRTVVSSGAPLSDVVLTGAQLDLTGTSLSWDLTDQAAGPDNARSYAVAVTTQAGTATSDPTSAEVYDYSAPDPVIALKAGGTLSGVNLSWTGSPSTDVAAQDLYLEEGPNAYLNATPAQLTSTVRSAAKSTTVGKDYTASVVARDAVGNISSPTSVTVRATALALSRNISTITYGGYAVLSAKLTKVTGGATLPNAQITFQWRKKGTATWNTFAGVQKTGILAPYVGIARLTVKPLYNVEYQATYKGGTNLFGRTSAVTSVLVKPTISSRITNTSGTTITSVRYGSYVYFKATVNPKHVGQYLIIQRYTSAGWRTLTSVKLNSLSAIAYRYKPPKGTFSYRIYKAADSDHAATYGSTLRLKIS